MKNKQILLMIAAMAFTLSACSQTDVVAQKSIESFHQLAVQMEPNLVSGEDGYRIISPDNTETLLLGENISLLIDAGPFTDAGVRLEELPEDIKVAGGQLIITSEYKNSIEQSLNAAFERNIWSNRKQLSYHTNHDIFELVIAGGHSFKWAKDMENSEKDMVFSLDPEPFIQAGLDPDKLDGWGLTTLDKMEAGGKITQVDKLLKIYNMK